MSLKTDIEQAIKEAMMAKDQTALRALRAIKAAILLALTEKGAEKELSAETELKILQKMAKQRQDSIAIFTKEGRTDLAQKEEEELEVISRYLPKQLSDEELKQELTSIIAQAGVSDLTGLGRVMGVASKQLAGKADGGRISQLVRQLLS